MSNSWSAIDAVIVRFVGAIFHEKVLSVGHSKQLFIESQGY